MGSKTETFRWSKGGPALAAGAGAARAVLGEVAVQKVDRIDQVLIIQDPSASPPVPGGGGVRTAPPGGGGAAKGDDIDRKAEEFINRQRSMWALRSKPGGTSSS
ncbi:hypothetical protein PAHAL_3G113900 [Panicum hallii]|jgi:hypothetical protein|uniref:Uncharacterized protein n=1 Tax=Panicum hallii TaxID=206008 RepID=A0A2S3H7Z0_9POAL|nr:hypothetical protein PAHAL_3G113900 [Panicum hallii]